MKQAAFSRFLSQNTFYLLYLNAAKHFYHNCSICLRNDKTITSLFWVD
jgi:hypothetical protein